MNKKCRYWLFEMYEDSRPIDWLDRLTKTMLRACVSPRHDKDLKEDGSGEFKKPHYHIVLCFEGPTTYNNALSIAKFCVGSNIVLPCYSVRGSVEYFIHLNQEDKAQYDPKDYIFINGFNINDYLNISPEEEKQYKIELINLIRNHKFIEYSEVADYLIDNEMFDLFYVFSNHTIFYNSYLKSKNFACKTNDNLI